MRVYFVDSWFFIARSDPSDAGYARASRIEKAVGGSQLVTHDGVFAEVLAFFADDGAFVRQRVANVIQGIVEKRSYEVARFSDLFHAALGLYQHRPDKEYSLVDCASMVLMKRLGIQHVLTNDHHFRQEGFVVVNE